MSAYENEVMLEGGDAIAAWDRKGLRVKSGGFGNAHPEANRQSPQADQGRYA